MSGRALLRQESADWTNDKDVLQFGEWLRQGKLPEIKASVQQRSVKTALALIESGIRLLRLRSFDALSIEEVCAGASTTVGAFYGRFEDKTSFFVSMQRVACLRSELALAELIKTATAESASLEFICHMVVRMSVQRYRSNVGIFRAALQRAHEGAWQLFKQLGDTYRASLTRLLSPHLDHLSSGARKMRIQFAYQAMVATLVHASLNDPGPVHLNEDSMVNELTRLITSYLKSP